MTYDAAENRYDTAATNAGIGSIAETDPDPTRSSNAALSAPGPLPTSSTSMPGSTPAHSANRTASGVEKRPMNRS